MEEINKIFAEAATYINLNLLDETNMDVKKI